MGDAILSISLLALTEISPALNATVRRAEPGVEVTQSVSDHCIPVELQPRTTSNRGPDRSVGLYSCREQVMGQDNILTSPGYQHRESFNPTNETRFALKANRLG